MIMLNTMSMWQKAKEGPSIEDGDRSLYCQIFFNVMRMNEDPEKISVPVDEDQSIIKCSCRNRIAHESVVCEHCRGIHRGLPLPDHARMFYDE